MAALPETNGNISQAVAMAVAAGYQKAMQQQQRDLARLQVTSESYLY